MTEHASATERERIRAVVEGLWAAIGTKNVDEVLRHYAPEVVQYSPAPPLRSIGPDATALAAWFRTWRGGIGLESQDLVISAGEDVGFCTSQGQGRSRICSARFRGKMSASSLPAPSS